ncbi:MAG TPA: TolC family protein [Bacteroidales bacterium]|nr:TolC family protein [Bacteroidales bacterium]HON20796.1 TolC family protein [Bacteroidales bacterium]HOR81124.1 TolC family protein [Bacteroidales bacterium]HPJ90754.1 TolC family protein [Bacteroidales bacterium]
MIIEKKFIVFVIFIIAQSLLFGQKQVTLKECQEWAIEHSSASTQLENLERLRKIKRQIIKSFIPNVNLNASVNYQSHTLPSINKDETGTSYLDFYRPISKDQYLVSLDLAQKVWDGGVAKSQQQFDEVSSDIEVQNVHIKTYEFKEEISKMFLTVLYLQENSKIIATSIQTLKEDLKKLEALYQNGIILESNIYILEAEIMRIEQELQRIKLQQQSIRSALSEFTKRDLSQAEFIFTETEDFDTLLKSNRPEFTLFQLQKSALDYQKKLLMGQSMPKINIFASGGYGRPTYNLMDNNFNFMYIVGAKLYIPITSWGSVKNGNDYLNIQKNLITAQANDYEQSLRVRMMEKLNEMKNLQSLLISDEEIIEKRKIIVNICANQLKEGVITASDYIKEVNALNEVSLNKQLHKIQLEQAKINFNFLKGSL